MQEITAAQIVGISFDVVGWSLFDRSLLLRQQLDFELLHNCVRDLILNREDVGEIAIKALCPDVAAIL